MTKEGLRRHTNREDYNQEHYNIKIEETQQTARRLNVFVPHVFREYEFGGLSSVLELARYLSPFYDAVRFVSLLPTPGPEDCVAVENYTRGPAKNTVHIASLAGGAPLTCHERDIFLCSYWPSVFAWEIFADRLREINREPTPFYYFIQDWEPGFYPMGYKHLLAESTYKHTQHCTPIFNSVELAKFFKIKNYKFNRQFVIKPSFNNAFYNLFKTLAWELPPKPSDTTTILIYGRPNQPRNCFDFILESLEKFCDAQPLSAIQNLTFLSVGLPHDPVAFNNGALLKSLGKLSLHDYSMLLLNSHVGLSVMASPHPSYPPLEMAAFGLQVVTNNYIGKQLNGTHPNITALPTLDSARMAEALATAIRIAQNQAGVPTRVAIPTSLSPQPWLRNFEASKIPIL